MRSLKDCKRLAHTHLRAAGNLADITIPDSLQTLGQDCFKECNKLQLIDMSKVPDTFIERQTYLTGMVTFPDWLVVPPKVRRK